MVLGDSLSQTYRRQTKLRVPNGSTGRRPHLTRFMTGEGLSLIPICFENMPLAPAERLSRYTQDDSEPLTD
jgi:hypothetical protein